MMTMKMLPARAPQSRCFAYLNCAPTNLNIILTPKSKSLEKPKLQFEWPKILIREAQNIKNFGSTGPKL